MTSAEKNHREVCPHCGSADVIPIEYGYPTPEMTEASQKENVMLGGCAIEAGAPKRHCKACQTEF